MITQRQMTKTPANFYCHALRRDRHRDTKTKGPREPETQRPRDTQTQRHTDTQTHTRIQTHRETHTHRDTEEPKPR